MDREPDGRPTERLRPHRGSATALYRVAWSNGKEAGFEDGVHTDPATAVEIAEALQKAAADRPVNIQFSVVREIGNRSETVHRCDQ